MEVLQKTESYETTEGPLKDPKTFSDRRAAWTATKDSDHTSLIFYFRICASHWRQHIVSVTLVFLTVWFTQKSWNL